MWIFWITDICSGVVSLLQELTDVDPNSEGVENIKKLIDHLCENQIISLIVGGLDRFDEKNKDESDAIHNCLGICENILEVRPSLSADCSKQGLLPWLLKRIKVCFF
jgi:beta-catenin-like protein 1